MKGSALLVFAYAILIMLGGLIGYWKAHSVASLISGEVFGFALLVCSYGIWKNSKIGINTALILSLLLTIFFGYRYMRTYNFIPAGLLSLISVAVWSILLLCQAKDSKGNDNANSM